jgi:hypothetical protein
MRQLHPSLKIIVYFVLEDKFSNYYTTACVDEISGILEKMAYEMSKELHYKEINIQTHWVLRKQLKFQIN